MATFQERYNDFRRELLELKTSHNARSAMRTFYATQTIEEMQNYTPTTIRLTYADGDQPIMTTVVGIDELIPLKPSGNIQDFYLAYGDSRFIFYKTAFFFLSTRKIESIQVIQ